MKTKVKIYIVAFLIIILTTFNLLYSTHKENIYNATINDLDNVSEIGEILSNRIYLYVQTNDIQSVDELEGQIDNVGEVRLKELKKIYK